MGSTTRGTAVTPCVDCWHSDRMTTSILTLGVFVLPAVVLALAIRMLLRARRSVSWPTVEATILESRVLERKKRTFEPSVVYVYATGGQRLTGRRLWVGLTFATSGGWAQRIVASYPVGTLVRAAVDPGDPGYSVLVTGLRFQHVAAVLLSAVFTIMGLVAVVASARAATPW